MKNGLTVKSTVISFYRGGFNSEVQRLNSR